MYQWDRIEILETNSICSQMICNKIIRIHNRERMFYPKMTLGIPDIQILPLPAYP